MIIYCLTNTVNGKKYVGMTTKTLEYRVTGHFGNASHDSCMYILRAIAKYGREAFVPSVLQECATFEEMVEAEKFWIAKFNTMDHTIGYNLTSGGEGTPGHNVSDTTRQLMSEFHKRENMKPSTIALISHAAKIHYDNGHGEYMRSRRKCGKDHFFYGKAFGRTGPLSEETKRNISIARSGTFLSEEHKENIGVGARKYYDEHPGPNLGKSWTEQQHLNDWHNRLLRKKPVFGFDVEGECCVMYFSINDAVIATSLTRGNIANVKKKQIFFDGITYFRSAKTFVELKRDNKD